LLLWTGDVESAKAGWRKPIEARKQIEALVKKDERKWSEYYYEELMCGPCLLIGGMLAAPTSLLTTSPSPAPLNKVARLERAGRG